MKGEREGNIKGSDGGIFWGHIGGRGGREQGVRGGIIWDM